MNAAVEARLRTDTTEYWIETLNAAGVPCGRVMGLAEMFSDPQVLDQEMVLSQEHPGHGTVKMLGFPIKFAEAPCRCAGPRRKSAPTPTRYCASSAIRPTRSPRCAAPEPYEPQNRRKRNRPPRCGGRPVPKTRIRLHPGAIRLALAADLVRRVGRRRRVEPVPAVALPYRRTIGDIDRRAVQDCLVARPVGSGTRAVTSVPPRRTPSA